MNRRVLLILLFFTLAPFHGCIEWSVPAEFKGDRWGMISAEYVKKIEFRDTAYEHIDTFKARISSKYYGVRFLFPNIINGYRDSCDLEIDRQFNDFEFKIIDLSNSKILYEIHSEFKPNSKGAFYYLRRDSLVLGAYSNEIMMKKNRKYKILMKIPEKRKVDNRVQNVILNLGTLHSVFYP